MLRLIAFVTSLLLFAASANAQVFFGNTRVGNVTYTRGSVGTSTADAISASAVSPGLLGWQICNDAVNASSTYLAIGEAVDVSTDGVRIGLGACFVCTNCNAATLKAINVEGQGTDTYTVIQYKQQ